MTTTEPTAQPKRNVWKIASLVLAVVAAILFVLIVVLFLTG
jgi:uncharacterized membrane protein YidH (DUF202 family)